MSTNEFPITSQQVAMLDFIDGRTDDYYLMVEAFHLRGPIDIAVLRDSVVSVVLRHEVLRAVFPADSALYRVLPLADDMISDLFTVSEGHTTSVPEALAAGVAHVSTAIALDEQPPFRIWVCPVDAESTVIAIGGHHLVFDAWSFMLFYEDLAAEYKRIRDSGPERPTPPQYTSARPAQAPPLDGWSDLFDRPYKGIRELQASAATPKGAAAMLRRTWSDFGNDVAVAAKGFGVTPYVLGAAAMLSALAEMLDDKQVIMGTAYAGRASAASVNAMGYFSTTLFVGADLGGEQDLVSGIDSILRQWHRAPRIQWEDLLDHYRARDVYPVKFSFQPTHLASPALVLDGAATERLRPSGGGGMVARRPIDVLVGYDAKNINAGLVYRTDAVDEPSAVALLDNFAQQLRELCYRGLRV